MIAFVTLLLGLISGSYPIQVTVSGSVAAVEFRLDGAPAGRVQGPPWTGVVDLGKDLRPHILTAHALDAEGKEIAQVTQWINMPRPPAEVEIVLEKAPGGAPVATVLTWQSVNGVEPASMSLTLDGDPLVVEKMPGQGRARAALPARDLQSLHVLSAELWFPPGLTARKDVAYGGEYGSEVSTELTAVPVRLTQGATLPPPEGLKGWLTAGGRPLTVAAVEDGPGKVLVVRVPPANTVLRQLLSDRQRPALPTFKNVMRLGKEDSVRFVSLQSNPFHQSRVPSELFDISEAIEYKEGGMFWLLCRFQFVSQVRPGRQAPLRVVNAVAVAGLQAASDNHRRAVLLVLGDKAEDASQYEPDVVRRYLETIRVPLFVWSLYGPEAAAAKEWTGAEDVSNLPRMRKAAERLRNELASQRIVWVEGRHLPQSISLTPEAKGIELVTAP